jgi:hypothetical protein
MSEANDNPFGKTYLGFLFVSVVIVFMVSLLLPFPISLAVSIIILLCVCVIRADIAIKEPGMGGSRVGIGSSHRPNLVEGTRTTYWIQ